MEAANIQLIVVNRLDEIFRESGVTAAGQIRRVTLNEVRVNPKVNLLGLPSDKIEELGLVALREVAERQSDGVKPMRVFQDAKVFLGDRVGVFQCLELPEGSSPVLGGIPMMALGLELDPITNDPILLPEPYYRA